MSPRWMESSRRSTFAKLVQVPNYKYELLKKNLNHRIYFSTVTSNKINEIMKT